MTTDLFNLNKVHPSWRPHISKALEQMDPNYLKALKQQGNWLPGKTQLFNAFTIPLNQVNYVLFGESPYPRSESANGYAFWDAAVKEIWSEKGLSKPVNRATSLRNIYKMLLVAAGKLKPSNTTQDSIANIDKSKLIQQNQELFQKLTQKGFLLLNASLVLQQQSPQIDAKAWLPFTKHLIKVILRERPQAEFILFGKIAEKIIPLLPKYTTKKLVTEHPYNVSFISNKTVLDFFRPLNLLDKQN